MVCFFGEFVRAYDPGVDLKVSGAHIPASDAEKMIRLKEVECELLAGFSKMIQKLVWRASIEFGVEADDLFGEAFAAFLDAAVHYDGRSRFSTLLYICVRRHLLRACSNRDGRRIPADIRRLTMRVVDRMNRDRVTFDEAVDSEGVSSKKLERVVASMTRVCTASELDIRESEMASCSDRVSVSGVKKAIDSVKLTRLERAVLEGFMGCEAGKMGLSSSCADLVNPSTGRPYSRAALSAAWKQARKKLCFALKDVA
jgi:DNA-directed RNA polymerase specialized sigma24 family protein